MELDDLKVAWAKAGQTTGGASHDELIPRLRRLRRTILWRDAREMAAVAILFPVFTWIGWLVQVHGGPLAARIGVGLVLTGFLLIVAVLLWARRPRARAGSSVGAHLRAELTRLDRQISILQHAAWWAVGPILVGVNLFVAGVRSAHSMFAVTYAIVTLGAGVLLVWLNHRGAHKLRPLRDSLLRGLESVRESQTER
jgi:hypothetical protein